VRELAASLERLLSRASSEEDNTDSIVLATAELALALAKVRQGPPIGMGEFAGSPEAADWACDTLRGTK
jgi:hypothetical protein